MLSEAVPLGSGLVLRQFAWQADVLILAWLVDASALGLFSGPYRILLGVADDFHGICAPAVPGNDSLTEAQRRSLTEFYNRAMKWFCCLSVPGAVLFIVWPRILIEVLLGEKFIGAESAMQWFGVAFVPMFVSSLLPFIYTALRLTRVFCLAMAWRWSCVSAETWRWSRVWVTSAVVSSLSSVRLAAFAILAYFLKRKGIRFASAISWSNRFWLAS